ncbi:hypothetical protein THIOSC15_1240023 [uncultured Thiomicrorhabdus sp.]
MKKILCLGAKPNALIPKVDIVYGANASLARNSAAIHEIPKKNLIVAGSELGFGDDRDSSFIYSKRYEILSLNYDKVIVINSFNDFEVLNKIFKSKEVYLWNSNKRRNLSQNISGLKEPIISSKITKLGFFFFIEQMYKLFKSFIKIKLGFNADYSGYYRASTGMICLMSAISENTIDDVFIISGISFGKRSLSTATYGKDPRVTSREKNNFDHHVEADKKILNALMVKFNLYTTEKSIADEFGIPIYKDSIL